MAVVGMALALALVVLAVKLNIKLGHGLFAGTIVLALFGRVSPMDTLSAVWNGWVEPRGLALIAVVTLLMILSQHMDKSGQMERLFEQVRKRISSPRLALAIFPALIGLLPMPGGAVFSAPMVESAGRPSCLANDHKSLINIWFRHVWEYTWPLYPSLILIVALSGIPLSRMMPYLIPLTVAAVIIGYFFFLRQVKPGEESVETADNGRQSILYLASPILVVLVGALGGQPTLRALGSIWPVLSGLPGQAAMALALVAAVALAGWQSGGLSALRQVTFSKHTAMMVYLILSILAFKGVALASGGVDQLSRLLVDIKLPLIVLVIALPLAMGLITGIAVGYVATAFPVLIALIPPEAAIPYLVLGHVAGFSGVMTSPAHACIVLSNEYFHTPHGGVYRQIYLPQAILLAVAVVMTLWLT